MDIYNTLRETNKAVTKTIINVDKEFLSKITELRKDLNVTKLYPALDKNINIRFDGKKIHLTFTRSREIEFKDSNGRKSNLILEKDIMIIGSRISVQPLFIQK